MSVDFDATGTLVLGASNDFASRVWTISDQRLRVRDLFNRFFFLQRKAYIIYPRYIDDHKSQSIYVPLMRKWRDDNIIEMFMIYVFIDIPRYIYS